MMDAEYRPLLIAIVLSVAVHLGFGFSNIIHPQPKMLQTQAPTVVMRQFTLETPKKGVEMPSPPPAPAKPKPIPKPKPKPIPKPKPKVAEAVVPVIDETEEERQPENIEQPEIQEEKSIWTVVEDEPETTVTEETPVEEEEKNIAEETPLEEETTVAEETNTTEETAVVEEINEEKNTQTAGVDDGIIRPKTALRPQFPNSAKLKYEGPMGITGTMNYTRNGSHYKIEASFNIPFNKRQFITEGEIQGNNLIPKKYTDKRKGKVYATAIFDYENKVIIYGSGEQPTQVTNGEIDFTKTPGYDLFSWAWQVAINGGNMPQKVMVTNGKKVYVYNTVDAHKGMSESLFDTNEGKLRVLNLPFERKGSETEYEFSFAPDFANVPAIITLRADGKTHRVHLIGVELDGTKHWQAMRQTGVRNKD